MWQGYYDAIFRTLFIPFLFYMTSFILYSSWLGVNPSRELDLHYIGELTCLVIFGKTFVTFLILELIQLKEDPVSYFTDFWNIIDCVSLVSCATYVGCLITNSLELEDLNLIGALAVMLLWVKLFYWMRLFRTFSAFVRVISEIVVDIKVFFAMLLLCLMAFANIIIVLNLNRTASGNPEIVDPIIGFFPLDALLHAYLTGLGEYGFDNYSEQNMVFTWIVFIIATLIIQIIFFNMLIAIMSESFMRITAV